METTSARAHRHARIWLECIVATAVMLATASSSAMSHRGTDEAPLTAIWHVQTLPFEYRSLNTYYACDALEDRVREMLELMGARPPVVVRTNCSGFHARHISAEITVATPVPATEENLRVATTYDSKDELVARMNGLSLPSAAEVGRFYARWQRRDVRVDQNDCELMRGIQEQIMPKLSVRMMSKKMRCPSRMKLHYEALIALPAPAHAAAPQS